MPSAKIESPALGDAQHGFRSGVVGTQNDPNDLKVIGVSRTVPAIMPMPRLVVMNRILQALSK